VLTRRRDERGAVAIMIAVMATILFVVGALVVDLGLARDTRRQSQNAADAASLAAANVLYPKSGLCVADPAPGVPPCYVDAVNAARSYSATNFGVGAAEWASCTDAGAFYVPPTSTPCISFTDETGTTAQVVQPTRVRVLMPVRNVSIALGAVATSSDAIPITASARAALDPGSARSCGLCILGPNPNGLGNADVTVSGGNVHSNGDVNTGPNGLLSTTPSPNAITTSGRCIGICTPFAEEGVPPIEDPYADVVSFPLAFTNTVKTDPCTQGPGVYGAKSFGNNLTCNLSAGLYVLTGTWTLGNQTILRGTGVTLYGTCGTTASPQVCSSTGQTGGGLDGKNGETQLVAPTTGPLEGLVVVYDPGNTHGLNLQGNGASAVTGAVYAASATLQFPGNSSFSVTNGPVIVGSLYGNGNNGGISLLSSVGANIPTPPEGVRLDQ
jgi:Flp pilus assembly protein TadG